MCAELSNESLESSGSIQKKERFEKKNEWSE
jgi:hypothetical protein